MYRVFCDGCGKDITDYQSSRAVGKLERITVEIMVAVDNVWNGGHACEDCIKAACAISEIKKRPNVASSGQRPT